MNDFIEGFTADALNNFNEKENAGKNLFLSSVGKYKLTPSSKDIV